MQRGEADKMTELKKTTPVLSGIIASFRELECNINYNTLIEMYFFLETTDLVYPLLIPKLHFHQCYYIVFYKYVKKKKKRTKTYNYRNPEHHFPIF